MHYTFSR